MSNAGNAAAGAAQDATASRARLIWVDMARGACVLAVVLLHVEMFAVNPMVGDLGQRPGLHVFLFLEQALLTQLRMPLLLFLSGWLAASKMNAGLGNRRTREFIAANLYLFALWTILFAALEVLVAPGPDRVLVSWHETPLSLVEGLLYPGFGPMWFVWLLGVSGLVLAATRSWPRWVVVLGLTGIGYLALALSGDVAGAPRAVFFALGVYVGPRLFSVLRRPLLLWALVAVTTVGAGALTLVSLQVGYLGSVALGVPVAVSTLAAMKLLSRWGWFAQPLAWVGRRTLGVYILHWPLVGALALETTAHRQWFAWLGSLSPSMTVLTAVYPVLLSVVIALAAIALRAGLTRCRLGWLFALPAPLARRLGPAEAVPAGQPQDQRASSSSR